MSDTCTTVSELIDMLTELPGDLPITFSAGIFDHFYYGSDDTIAVEFTNDDGTDVVDIGLGSRIPDDE